MPQPQPPAAPLTGSGHQLVEHTADIGIRAWSLSEAGLFREAALGLIEVLVGPVEAAGDQELVLTLEAASGEELLVAWLNELLFQFEARAFLPAAISVEIRGDRSLRAQLQGERYDPRRHPLERQVKAATYHQLQIVRREAIWQATIYLDL